MLRWLIEFFRPIPKCPRCRLMRIEGQITNCPCAFANGTDD